MGLRAEQVAKLLVVDLEVGDLKAKRLRERQAEGREGGREVKKIVPSLFKKGAHAGFYLHRHPSLPSPPPLHTRPAGKCAKQS